MSLWYLADALFHFMSAGSADAGSSAKRRARPCTVGWPTAGTMLFVTSRPVGDYCLKEDHNVYLAAFQSNDC
jgi:hypothetical protein